MAFSVKAERHRETTSKKKIFGERDKAKLEELLRTSKRFQPESYSGIVTAGGQSFYIVTWGERQPNLISEKKYPESIPNLKAKLKLKSEK